jgi:SAM-dependent methyltransferase
VYPNVGRPGTEKTTRAEIGTHVPMREAHSPAADTRDYLALNAAAWDQWALKARASARVAWRDEELRWGLWNIAESNLQLLHDLQPGADVIELGCGTAAIPAWFARRGFRPVGVDFCRRQLETVDRLQQEFSLPFPLVHANAEEVPFDRASFDLVISEYGPSVWCDPQRWLFEAHRLLRPDGRLVFFTNSAMMVTCTPGDGGPAGETLERDYFSRYRLEFPAEGTVEFHLTHGAWVRALRERGFVLEDLMEVRPPAGSESRLDFASIAWARRWPSEDIWTARKVGI